jgi:MFS family permease
LSWHKESYAPAVASANRIPYAAWLLSAAFFLVFLGGGAFQQFVGPYLRVTYHLGVGAAATVLATVYLVAFACLTFATYSMSLLGEYWALILAMLSYGVLDVVALITGNLAVLILAAVVWGWGASVLWTAGTAFALDLAGPGAYGRLSGILYSGVYIGQALGVLLLGALSGLIGARGLATSAAAITLAGAMAALRLPRQRHPRAPARLLNPLRVFEAATTRRAALVLLLASSGFGLLLGAFGQVVATLYGLAAVGWITGAFYVARIPAGAGGGRLIDRFGRRPVLQTAFFVSVGALLLTALLQQPALLVLCALALGVQAAVVPVGLTTWVGDHARAENRPYTYAAVALWSNMGTGLAILGGPWLLAVLGGWRGIFGFFAAIFLICALLARRLD